MKDIYIHKIIKILKEEYKKLKKPYVTADSERKRDPFRVLLSTIISLRTKDSTTAQASKILFKLATSPEDVLSLKISQIEKAIYPAGFYRVKAKTIKDICEKLVKKYDGKVPDNIDELLRLKGVGRKTANLVVTLGYNKPGICVDTHVHRIFNRLGYVNSKTPDSTEIELRKKLPKKYWIEINSILVAYGQNICKPVGPRCDICKIESMCMKVGVKK